MGLKFIFFSIDMSSIRILKSDSSFNDPPILITMYSFLYLFKYFLTSLMEGPFEGKIDFKFTSSIDFF